MHIIWQFISSVLQTFLAFACVAVVVLYGIAWLRFRR